MPSRPKLSLCMIVRDSERTLPACLKSIRPWVDEIIIVDTGSKDGTKAIARQYGALVFDFPWIDDFAAARNESLRHASGEWLVWMDSDDTIDEQNGQRLWEIAHSDHEAGVLGYVLQVHCPAPSDSGGEEVTVVDHVKLIRNDPQLRFEGRIHEQVLPSIRRLGGTVQWTDLFVVHSGAEHTAEAKQRKYERDLRILAADLKERPDHPFVLFNLGMTYEDMGLHSEAEHWLRRCLSVSDNRESNVRKAYALLISCLDRQGRVADALELCKQGLSHYANDEELRFRRGILEHKAHHLEEAIDAYVSLLHQPAERHFTSIDQGILGYKARHNLGLVYQELGRLDLAELQWRRALEQIPTFRPSRRSLFQVLMQQKKRVAVTVEANRRTSKEDEADAWVARGQVAASDNHLDEARSAFTTSLQLDPSSIVCHEAWCEFLFNHGTLNEAESAIERLTELKPDDASAWRNLGTVCLRSGNYERAASALRRSLFLRPQDPATQSELYRIKAYLDSASAREAGTTLGDTPEGGLGSINLPECHCRREYDAAERKFFCAHPRVGAADGLVSPGCCRACSLSKEPPPQQFRTRPKVADRRRSGTCSLLGEQIGVRSCPGCRGNVQIKVFACHHPDHVETTHDECTRCCDYKQADA